MLGGPDAKFGIPPYQIVQAYKKAKENGSTRFGIHMMTGSCVMNNHVRCNVMIFIQLVIIMIM